MIHAIGTITARKSAALRLSSEPLLKQYAAIHSINLEAQADKIRQKAIRKVSARLREILFGSTIHLILHHEDLDAERVMTSELKIFLGESRAKEVNTDLEETTDVEDARKEAMEGVMGNLVKAATEKEVKKSRTCFEKNLRRPRNTMLPPTTPMVPSNPRDPPGSKEGN